MCLSHGQVVSKVYLSELYIYLSRTIGHRFWHTLLTYFLSALKPLPKCLQHNKAQSRLLIVLNMIKKLLNSHILLSNFQNKTIGRWRISFSAFSTQLTSCLLRRRSTPVSTVLQKSVTFFIINIVLIIKTLPRLESGQYPVWMTMRSRKGDFKEWKSKKFPGGACLRTPLEACAFAARSGNRLVFILDPRLLLSIS